VEELIPVPVLYSFRRCPYAMRARLALYTAKIPHEHREVSLKNKPLEMLTISPKGTVPVMLLKDGTVLEESLHIMKWALKSPPLSPEDEEIIQENDTTFKHALDHYKYPERFGGRIDINDRHQCEIFLRLLEERLHPYLTGKTPTFTDIALFPFIRQFSKVEPEWFQEQPYPHLKEWLDLWTSSPLFQKVMENYAPWTMGNQPILIKF